MNSKFPAISFLTHIKWGNWSLICLYISIISGIVVGVQYNYSQPYYSTTAIDVLIPYGSYFRSLHFYSSQFFFFFTVIHFVAVFNSIESQHKIKRYYLILTLPVILLLLFTGYVLRSDSTGSSAGMIAENILIAIPLVGSALNELLFSITDNGMQRVYLHHVVSFDILFLVFAWDHLKRYRVHISSYLLLIASVLLFSILIDAPLEQEELGKFYITGPWFFLGLQELLRYFDPFIAGILVPCSLIGAMIIITMTRRWLHHFLLFICIWLGCYGLLTIAALIAHN